jgi:GT2 family glycosyltransferase
MQNRRVTVIIPTFNRPKVLSRVVNSYLAQPQCAELIVVDDGSHAPAPEVWETIADAAAAEDVELHIIRHDERRGASAARNTAIEMAACPYIMTTDDDIILGPDYLQDCLNVHEDIESVGYVGGRVVYLRGNEDLPTAKSRILATKVDYLNLSDLTICFWGHADHPIAVPFCSAVGVWKKEVFEAGLRYDEGYGGNAYREETDPQIAAQIAGWQVVYHPDAFAFHLPPAEINAASAGQHRGGPFWYEYWAMRNNIRFLHKYRKFLRDRWQARPLRSAINFELSRAKRGVTKVMGLRKAA